MYFILTKKNVRNMALKTDKTLEFLQGELDDAEDCGQTIFARYDEMYDAIDLKRVYNKELDTLLAKDFLMTEEAWA